MDLTIEGLNKLNESRDEKCAQKARTYSVDSLIKHY